MLEAKVKALESKSDVLVAISDKKDDFNEDQQSPAQIPDYPLDDDQLNLA